MKNSRTCVYRLATLLVIAILTTSCGRSRMLTVGDVSPWPVVAMEDERVIAPAAEFRLQAVGATFVHSIPRWADVALSDRGYLLVGADERPGFWFTYVAFDLKAVTPQTLDLATSGVDPGKDCQESSMQATMRLSTMESPPLRGEHLMSELHVFQVFGDVDLDLLSWENQPNVDAERRGRAVLAATREGTPAVAYDLFDVSDIVCHAIKQGVSRLVLAIVPADPSRDFRRRWHSADEHLSGRSPTLVIRAGGENDVWR